MTNLPLLLWPTPSLSLSNPAPLLPLFLRLSLPPPPPFPSFSLTQCTSKTNLISPPPLLADPPPPSPPWISPTVSKRTEEITTVDVAVSPKKATSVIFLLHPPLPLHQRKLQLTLLFQSPLPLLVLRHASSTQISAERCHLMIVTYGVTRQRLKSMNRRWICLVRAAGSCRWAVCGRFWGGCRRRVYWRQVVCVRDGERQRGGCGGRRRSLDLGFHLGLSLGLLDLCCRSVLDLVDLTLDWKG